MPGSSWLSAMHPPGTSTPFAHPTLFTGIPSVRILGSSRGFRYKRRTSCDHGIPRIRKGCRYMALVAETLVEEWLHRKGYFTIRGIKTGSGETDLLAASFREPAALHVEVNHRPSWLAAGRGLFRPRVSARSRPFALGNSVG